VIICVQKDNTMLAAVLGRAELTATGIFAGIGVSIVGRGGAKLPPGRSDITSIEMQFDANVPAQFHPGDLAYAVPYADSGTRIRCSRIVSPGVRQMPWREAC
jgi:hypothetical protein